MKIYLATYRPIVRFPEGRHAIAKYDLPPFIDYSCRKEPDFMSVYPSISALCRADKFVPRLYKDDIAIFITSKGSYLGIKQGHWRLTAILQVLKRFESHPEAANWYQNQNIALPGNCMVAGNSPVPIDRTAPVTEFKADLRRWDLAYQQRARKCGVFLACNSLFMELYNPPIVTDEMMQNVFGRVPGTQNPPSISSEEFDRLKRLSGISL